MIIGVALVVDEFHKGQRLVFRYPDAHPSSALFSGEMLARFHDEYLSLTPDNFARLFRPKPAFFNKILEITIGDINYISYPAPCLTDYSACGAAASAAPPSTDSCDSNIHSPEDERGGDDVITLFTVVVARVRDCISRPGAAGSPGVDPVSKLIGMSGQFLPVAAPVIRDVVTTVARALLREQFRCGYVSKEVKLMLGIQDAKNRGRAGGGEAAAEPVSAHSKAPTGMRLSQIQVIPEASTASLASPSTRGMSGELSTGPSDAPNLTNSSAQIDASHVELTLEGLADKECATPGTPRVPYAPTIPLPTATGPDINLSASFSELIMMHSTLANEFRSLYHSLIGGMHVNLTVNRCLWITMPLRPVSELASPALIRAPAIGSPFVENPSVARTADLPEKKPFQTFLTVGDEAGIRTVITTLQARVVDSQSVSQKDVTGRFDHDNFLVGREVDESRALELDTQDSSVAVVPKAGDLDMGLGLVTGKLWDFLCRCDPTKPYAELAEIMEYSLEEVYTMAAQLETFGLGRSINCLSAASLYAVHPHADVDVTARASRAFFGVFGGALQCELHTVLAKFNGATSLGEILQQVSSPVQDYMIDIVTWLLRWGLLVEINIYLFDAVACFRPSKPLIPTANENMKKAMQSQIVEGMDNKIRNSLVGHLDGQTSLVELLWSEASLSADAVLSYAANNGISVIHHCYY